MRLSGPVCPECGAMPHRIQCSQVLAEAEALRDKAPSPPSTVTLRFCERCGQTDRVTQLRDRHKPPYHYDGPRAKGGLCLGPVRRVTYSNPEVQP
jgi:hypothetical protein